MSYATCFLVYIGTVLSILGCSNAGAETPTRPNIIILLADDMGYGDLFSTGHPIQEKNFIDQLFSEGKQFSNFYAAESVCTPSRAAILTGRLPARVGYYSAETPSTRYIQPSATLGLPREEYTIAELLSDAGYRTGMVGKWHLGMNKNNDTDGYYLPAHHGFHWVGVNLPMGNVAKCDETSTIQLSVCYVYDNTTIVEQPFQHLGLTQRITDSAMDFIEDSQHDAEKPFFLFASLLQPHVSLFDDFNSSRRGLYGDNINLLADSVQQIIELLYELEIEEDTFVFFASDHGADPTVCLSGGDNGIFQGGKGFMSEGSHHIPAVAWMPGTIEAGSVSRVMGSLMDLLPTFAELSGGSMPSYVNLDGVSLADVIFGGRETGLQEESRSLFFYCGAYLHAMRFKSYRVYFRSSGPSSIDYLSCICPNGQLESNDECIGTDKVTCDIDLNPVPIIYDIETDPREMYSLAPTQAILAQIETELAKHQSRFTLGEPLLDDIWCGVLPCCNGLSNNCVCNYDGLGATFSYSAYC